MSPLRDLDGADAGGQFVRTALTLSVLENEPIRIENVRGERSTPGLRHQHLAVCETMAAICDADTEGAEFESETVEFDPGLESTPDATGWSGRGRGSLPGGEYAVDIGTAGSATLLFDSLLALATVLEDGSELSVTVTGGTDVPFAPPLDYLRRVKLPLLRERGLEATIDVDRRGFYPNGGGRATLRLAPSSLEPIALASRGELEGVRVYSTESESLADRDVAHRQAEGAIERLALEEHGLAVLERRESSVESPSPGTAIVLRIDHGTGVAGFSALGERGKPAERVGEDAADAVNRFLDLGLEDGGEGEREREATGTDADTNSVAPAAPIDRHMADQLLVFLALAGGRVRVPAVTDHVETSLALLEAFGAEIALEESGDGDGGGAVVAVESTVDG